MKTVEEIIRPFIEQPDMAVEGHFAVESKGSKNMLKVSGLNKEYVMRAIITCNPELRDEKNIDLLLAVEARVEKEMQPSETVVEKSITL